MCKSSSLKLDIAASKYGWQPRQHISLTFTGKLSCSLSLLFYEHHGHFWSNNTSNHDTVWFLLLEMCSENFGNVSWWNGVNLIILAVAHSLHSEKCPHLTKLRLYLWHAVLLQNFPLSSGFCLQEVEDSGHWWILNGFYQYSFTAHTLVTYPALLLLSSYIFMDFSSPSSWWSQWFSWCKLNISSLELDFVRLFPPL